MVVIHGIEYVPLIKIGAPRDFGTLGAALRSMRKQAKMTIDSAAAEIGCTKSSLWTLENDRGEPGLRVAANIAGAYGVPLATLAACLVEREAAE